MAAPSAQAILAELNAGRFKQAYQTAKKAMAKAPRDAGLASLAALALTEMGRAREAVPLFQKAMKLAPQEPGHPRNLLQALVALDALDKAQALAEKLLARWPADAGMLYLSAIVLARRGEDAAALERAGAAIEVDPGNARVHGFRGGVLTDLGRYREAVEAYEAALALAPDAPEVLASMAKALSRLDQYDAALAALERAIMLEPGNLIARKNHAVILLERGDFDAAAQAFAALFEAMPDDADVAVEMAALTPKADLDPLRKVLAARQKNAPKRSRSYGMFGLARARAAQRAGDAEEARRNWIEGNGVLARLDPANEAGAEAEFDAVMAAFAEGMPEPAAEDGGPVPVIIAGLPRSGTTLTEQIVSAHPEIAGCGELPTAPRLVKEVLARGSTFDAGAFAAAYLAELPGATDTAKAFSDKMPMNYRYLGYLAAAFPAARFIHVARDPRDSALSMWRLSFADREMRYTHDLEALAAEINRYGRYMRRWRALLGERMIEVPYEEIVVDVGAASKMLAAHIGVDWHAAMARPEENTSAVRTASISQVRQPVHGGSVGGWRREAEMLAPFLERLDPEVWPDLA